MLKVMIKIVRPWPAEQPRPPVVHLTPGNNNTARREPKKRCA